MASNKYNTRNPAVKRILQVCNRFLHSTTPYISAAYAVSWVVSECSATCILLQEMKELQREPSSDYMAAAIEVSYNPIIE